MATQTHTPEAINFDEFLREILKKKELWPGEIDEILKGFQQSEFIQCVRATQSQINPHVMIAAIMALDTYALIWLGHNRPNHPAIKNFGPMTPTEAESCDHPDAIVANDVTSNWFCPACKAFFVAPKEPKCET